MDGKSTKPQSTAASRRVASKLGQVVSAEMEKVRADSDGESATLDQLDMESACSDDISDSDGLPPSTKRVRTVLGHGARDLGRKLKRAAVELRRRNSVQEKRHDVLQKYVVTPLTAAQRDRIKRLREKTGRAREVLVSLGKEDVDGTELIALLTQVNQLLKKEMNEQRQQLSKMREIIQDITQKKNEFEQHVMMHVSSMEHRGHTTHTVFKAWSVGARDTRAAERLAATVSGAVEPTAPVTEDEVLRCEESFELPPFMPAKTSGM